MSKEVLAKAGFYRTRRPLDSVKCFECSLMLLDWTYDDDPMVQHQRWNGRCRFLRKLPCGNVPLGVDSATVPPVYLERYRYYQHDYRMTAEADIHHGERLNDETYSRVDESLSTPTVAASTTRAAATVAAAPYRQALVASLNHVGITMPKQPDYPNYIAYRARLKSFDTENWSISSCPLTKEQLADAGFFYTGYDDRVMCFHCGGGLRYWKASDEPWLEHARWFSTCTYLRMVKGQEFIDCARATATVVAINAADDTTITASAAEVPVVPDYDAILEVSE